MSKRDLTTAQVAERLGVTMHAVRFWIKRGLLPNASDHVGDLSAVVCPGHAPAASNAKYREWAGWLFESQPSPESHLRRETRFRIEAWRSGSAGPWADYGAMSLTFLKYKLKGVASDLFPDTLLNSEGVNRC